jgi:hypothetical protein
MSGKKNILEPCLGKKHIRTMSGEKKHQNHVLDKKKNTLEPCLEKNNLEPCLEKKHFRTHVWKKNHLRTMS